MVTQGREWEPIDDFQFWHYSINFEFCITLHYFLLKRKVIKDLQGLDVSEI